MTGVPRIILSASSRNRSAVQTATRGQSHQLVHMTPSPGRLGCEKEQRGLCSGDCPFISNQHIPGEGGTRTSWTQGLGQAEGKGEALTPGRVRGPDARLALRGVRAPPGWGSEVCKQEPEVISSVLPPPTPPPGAGGLHPGP